MTRTKTCTVTLIALALTACAEPAPSNPLIEPSKTDAGAVAPVAAKTSVTDPTADRLHEISGDLLIYYARKHTLPPTLEAIGALAPDLPPLKDAGTGQPLIYFPDAPPIPGRPGNLLVQSPARNSQNGHWAILIKEAADKRTLSAQVVSLSPEENAVARARRAAPTTP
jgi:hypothetical protein